MQPLRGLPSSPWSRPSPLPSATRHLGDLGAWVIKVENSRAGGDFARDYDDVVAG